MLDDTHILLSLEIVDEVFDVAPLFHVHPLN